MYLYYISVNLKKKEKLSSVKALPLILLLSLLPSSSFPFFFFQCYTGYEEVYSGFCLPVDIYNI